MKAESVRTDALAEQLAVARKRRKRAEIAAVLFIIAAGAAVRTLHLDARPFGVDEAESSINALTILQHGYPADSYLGMPIYENTHVWFWPENPEYEFRDVSYSENHFAVYHGWLPLYAIAGSFALHGIHPDQADGTRLPKHGLAEQKRRTRAARLPAVLFAAMFLGIAFIGGNILYGREAGWTALIVGSIYPYHLYVSSQARYYSAQVTLATACCILLWLVMEKCRWRDVGLAAAAFILLFHTHLQSFLTAAVMAALCMPPIVHRHSDWFRKMALFAAIVAAGTLPWIIVTGFYRHQNRIPRAWPFLQIPSDLLQNPPLGMWNAVAGLIILISVFLAYLYRKRVSPGAHTPAKRLGPILLYLGGWALVGYATFLFCIPAVSFARSRLNLSYWGPLFLLWTVMSTILASMLTPRVWWRSSPVLASLFLTLLIFFATGHWPDFGQRPGERQWGVYEGVFKQLDSMRLDSATKLYAAPNRQLVLTFYSGLPIQDITPVRKSYLNSYRGDIVYINADVSMETPILNAENVQETALQNGYALSADAAEELSIRLRTRPFRESIMETLAPGQPSELEPLLPFAQGLLASHRAQVALAFANFDYSLVTRGFQIHDWSDWCAVLKYRFVDPQSRRGIHANYAERLRGADAIILEQAEPVAIFHSRWHPSYSTEPLTFRYIR